MDQKAIYILVILVFYQITSGAVEDKTVGEGADVDIKCHPNEMGSVVIWFRVLEKSGMEFIASYSNRGEKKQTTTRPTSTFTDEKIAQNTLILRSFNKERDSGVYSCASLYRSNELKFGKVIRLAGEKEKAEVVPVAPTTTKQKPCTSAAPCVCDNVRKKGETSPDMYCTPIMLGPLAGGCGLLLLLLIFTILYCNKIRTHRCPHHYKRKPRMTAAGKQMPNRHV